GYVANHGRYTPGDVYHPNGLAMLEADLAVEHELRLLNEPLSPASLFDADLLLAVNPDYPLYEGASPYRWTPEDVDAILAFLDRGGGVLLMVNSFLSRPDFWEENFDLERVSLLFDRLGIRWDPNYMSSDDRIEPARSGGDPGLEGFTVGYGQGGRVLGDRLPSGFEPLLTYQGMIYGFTGKVGSGRLAVMGDTGLISNGLLCFPGFDNAAFLGRLFPLLCPTWGDGAADRWDLRRYGHLSGCPSTQSLTEEALRNLRPQATWMVDHHYRHLYWDQEERKDAGAEVWQAVPVEIAALADANRATVPLRWLRLDSDDPGAEVDLELSVRTRQSHQGADLHAIGRVCGQDLPWAAVSRNPEALAVAGQLEQVHLVFQLDAVLDQDGRPRAARWRIGQIAYARDARAAHYGWTILLSSASGAIAPRASA
ncbi:MAG: hypothetical protein WDA75_23360, partial [Candidatus Latescibacterota bacterium]